MNAAPWHLRPLAAGELDHERLWLCVGAAGVAVALAGWRAGVRLPPCLFHLATGYPCPGCGSTRAVRQLAQGHLGEAFAFNPLFTAAVFAAAIWAVYAMTVLVLKAPRLRLGALSRGWSRGLRLAICAAVVANWWWLLAHGR